MRGEIYFYMAVNHVLGWSIVVIMTFGTVIPIVAKLADVCLVCPGGHIAKYDRSWRIHPRCSVTRSIFATAKWPLYPGNVAPDFPPRRKLPESPMTVDIA